jgi:hypothetical protein
MAKRILHNLPAPRAGLVWTLCLGTNSVDGGMDGAETRGKSLPA